jgi:membrane protein implicated in regulation of membrane protease activity
MPWQIVLLVVAAAVSGTALRKLVGFVAERTGHSRRAAEEAVGTMGLSLLVRREKPDR